MRFQRIKGGAETPGDKALSTLRRYIGTKQGKGFAVNLPSTRDHECSQARLIASYHEHNDDEE